MSFAALALRARAANDTTRAQINNIPEKSHVIPLLYMALTPGFEPGPHWWEVSALTTEPLLLPEVTISSGATIHTCYSWSPQYSILGRLQNSRVFTLKIVLIFSSTGHHFEGKG